MVPADSRRVPRAPRYSGIRLVSDSVRVSGFHALRRGFPDPFRSAGFQRVGGPTTPLAPKRQGFGLFPGRSPLLGESFLFSFPAGTKMFQFPAFASLTHARDTALIRGGLSHSEITGSRDICASPVLFAAYHVLHRLQEPRHPPCALFFLTKYHHHPIKGGWAYLMLVSLLVLFVFPTCHRPHTLKG